MASEFLVSVRQNMACWRAIVKSTRMQVLVNRSRASVGGRRCTWVPSRDGNCGHLSRQCVPVFPVQEIHLALLPPTSG